MSINNKKAEEGMSVSGIIIWLILGLIVMVAVIFFLFGNQIWDFFKNLPGYKYSDKDRIVDNLPADSEIATRYYKVAKVLNGKDINFCTEGDCGNLKSSKLYWYGDERQGSIYLDINWGFDQQVASVSNNKIILINGILDQNLDVDKTDLTNIDNSIYISGIIYRDKKSE